MRTPASILVLLAALLAVGSASASPSRDALLRPGVGIGELRVGMTLAQVKALLGRPEIVQKRRPYGFRSEYVEYAWGVSDWVVAVVGRGDRARVVSVATGLRSERTPRFGVGVGSTERDLRRSLGARCYGKEEQLDSITKLRVYTPVAAKDTMYCFLGRDRRAPHTGFSLIEECKVPDPFPVICPGEQRVYRVFEVRVGEPRFTWGYWGG